MNDHNAVAEVVWVKGDFHLVDSESYQRTYITHDGHPLACGYYIARWPTNTPNPHFLHDGLIFEGPYATRRDAQTALQSDAIESSTAA